MRLPGSWETPAQENRRFMVAIGAGLLLELGAVGLLLPVLHPSPPPALQPSVVKITIQAAPPAPRVDGKGCDVPLFLDNPHAYVADELLPQARDEVIGVAVAQLPQI